MNLVGVEEKDESLELKLGRSKQLHCFKPICLQFLVELETKAGTEQVKYYIENETEIKPL